MINYQIILCYHLIFNVNNYLYNFGLYVGLFLFFLILILCFYYCCKGKKEIIVQYLKNEPNLNEIREI